MIHGIVDAISDLVHIASTAERHDLTFFVLDDDGDKRANDYPPTRVRTS
jgi:hypothetical protein